MTLTIIFHKRRNYKNNVSERVELRKTAKLFENFIEIINILIYG